MDPPIILVWGKNFGALTDMAYGWYPCPIALNSAGQLEIDTFGPNRDYYVVIVE
jgi:hypothetical protein